MVSFLVVARFAGLVVARFAGLVVARFAGLVVARFAGSQSRVLRASLAVREPSFQYGISELLPDCERCVNGSHLTLHTWRDARHPGNWLPVRASLLDGNC